MRGFGSQDLMTLGGIVLTPQKKDWFSTPLGQGFGSEQVAVRDLLMLPHYACVKAAGVCLEHTDQESIVELVHVLAATSEDRAAIFLSDLYVSTKGTYRDWDVLVAALRRSSSWATLEQAVGALPSLDGHHLRTELLGHDRSESVSRLLAMITHLRSSFTEDLLEPFDFAGLSRDESREFQEDSEFRVKLQSAAQGRFNPLCTVGELEGRARHLCDEFNSSLGARYFPPEKYGYSSGAHMLALEMPEKIQSEFGYRVAGGEEGERSRDLRARMQARVLVPWADTPDLPSDFGHQCVDSASSARSFFVSRGIPAEVYLVRVDGMYHNVCVAFFKQDGRFTPVVVDPSPFDGAYPLVGPHKATFWRPQSILTVYSVRRGGLPFADGFFGGRGLSGFLPWSCVDIQEGRVIAFAGVRDEQCQPHLRWERGTDEYYGRGERERSLGFIAYFISNKSAPETGLMPNIHVMVQGGALLIKEKQGSVSPRREATILAVLRDQVPHLQQTIERLGIPLGHVTW
jgi:hypothetical protein